MAGSHEDMESFSLKKYIELKRKIYPGPIDVHPTENAIIVNYTAQAAILNDGQPIAGDKKACQKTIRLKSFHSQSNISSLANEIVEKCKLIHPSRVSEVEQLLYYLQKRSENGIRVSLDDKSWLKKQFEEMKQPQLPQGQELDVGGKPAFMNQIDSYVEGLYEEIKEKVISTRSILQLAKNPENMQELVSNVTTNKLGDMCLKITDNELNRFQILQQDLKKLEEKVNQTPNDKSIVAKLAQEHQKFQNTIKKQDQLFYVSFHLLLNLAEDLNIEVKMVKRDIIQYLFKLLDRPTPELLILALLFLKRLSIFQENKDQMMKNGDFLCSKLEQYLKAEHQGLQTFCLRLALNLAHDAGFRKLLIKKNLCSQLLNLLSTKNHLMLTIQLLYQLSIDPEHRNDPIFEQSFPFILRLVLEYKGERVNEEIMALAINLATVYPLAKQISQDSALNQLMKRAIKTRDPLVFKMLRNISMHDDITIKLRFLDCIDDIMSLLVRSRETPELLVELLGIMGNLLIPDFDFVKLCTCYDLLNFLSSLLGDSLQAASKDAENMGIDENDDVLVQVIVLIGTMSLDEGMSAVIANSRILNLLVEAMMIKEEDDEIILQVCYCIYQYLQHEPTRAVLLRLSNIVDYLIDLLYDRNVEIRKVCDASLSIIAAIDEDWDTRLRRQKFTWHNSEWIKMITQHDNDIEEDQSYLSKSESRQRMYTPAISDSDDEGYLRHGIGGSQALLVGPAHTVERSTTERAGQAESVLDQISADILLATGGNTLALEHEESKVLPMDPKDFPDPNDTVSESDDDKVEPLTIIESQMIPKTFWDKWKLHQELMGVNLSKSIVRQYDRDSILQQEDEHEVALGERHDGSEAKSWHTDRYESDDLQIVEVKQKPPTAFQSPSSMAPVGNVRSNSQVAPTGNVRSNSQVNTSISGTQPPHTNPQPNVTNPPYQRFTQIPSQGMLNFVQQQPHQNISHAPAHKNVAINMPQTQTNVQPTIQQMRSSAQQLQANMQQMQANMQQMQQIRASMFQGKPNSFQPLNVHGQQLNYVATTGRQNSIPHSSSPRYGPQHAQVAQQGGTTRALSPLVVIPRTGLQKGQRHSLPNQTSIQTTPGVSANPKHNSQEQGSSAQKSRKLNFVQTTFPKPQQNSTVAGSEHGQSVHNRNSDQKNNFDPKRPFSLSALETDELRKYQQTVINGMNQPKVVVPQIRNITRPSPVGSPSVSETIVIPPPRTSGSGQPVLQRDDSMVTLSSDSRSSAVLEFMTGYEPTNVLVELEPFKKQEEADRLKYSDLLDIGSIMAFHSTFGKQFLTNNPSFKQFDEYLKLFVNFYSEHRVIMSWYHDYLHNLLGKQIGEAYLFSELEKYFVAQGEDELAKKFKEYEFYVLPPKYHVEALMFLQHQVLADYNTLLNEVDVFPYRQGKLNSDKLKIDHQIKTLTETLEKLNSTEGDDFEQKEKRDEITGRIKELQNQLSQLETQFKDIEDKKTKVGPIRGWINQKTSRNQLGSDRDGKQYWALLPSPTKVNDKYIFDVVGVMVESDVLKPQEERTFSYVKDMNQLDTLIADLDPMHESERRLKEKIKSLKTYLESSMTPEQIQSGFEKFPLWVAELVSSSSTFPAPNDYDSHYGNLALEPLFNLGHYCGLTDHMKLELKNLVGKDVSHFKSLLKEWVTSQKWVRTSEARMNTLDNVKSFFGLMYWARSGTTTAKSNYISDLERLRLSQIQQSVALDAYVVNGKSLRASKRDKDEESGSSNDRGKQGRERRNSRRDSSDDDEEVIVKRKSRRRSMDSADSISSVTASSNTTSSRAHLRRNASISVSKRNVSTDSDEIDELVASDVTDNSMSVDELAESDDIAAVQPEKALDTDTDITSVSDTSESSKIDWVDDIPNTIVEIIIDNTNFHPDISNKTIASILFSEDSQISSTSTSNNTDPLVSYRTNSSKTPLSSSGNLVSKSLASNKKKQNEDLARALFGSESKSNAASENQKHGVWSAKQLEKGERKALDAKEQKELFGSESTSQASPTETEPEIVRPTKTPESFKRSNNEWPDSNSSSDVRVVMTLPQVKQKTKRLKKKLNLSPSPVLISDENDSRSPAKVNSKNKKQTATAPIRAPQKKTVTSEKKRSSTVKPLRSKASPTKTNPFVLESEDSDDNLGASLDIRIPL